MGGKYIIPSISGNFLSLSGGTVTGLTTFTSGLSATTFSADTANIGTLTVQDNKVKLNFNSTGSTELTSLGSGLEIQDGSGIPGTDVFFEVKGNLVGLEDRSFSTNVGDIVIRDTSTGSTSNGSSVIADGDSISGGFF